MCFWPHVTCLAACTNRVCHLHQGGRTLDDREPGCWQAPGASAKQPSTTNHATSNVSKKVDKTEAQTKQKTDEMKTNNTVALPLAHRCVFQPFVVGNTDTDRAWAFSHLAAVAFKRSRLRAEGEAPRGDCGFTIDETEHTVGVWNLPSIPAGRNRLQWAGMFLDTGCLAQSYLHLLFLKWIILNAETERG